MNTYSNSVFTAFFMLHAHVLKVNDHFLIHKGHKAKSKTIEHRVYGCGGGDNYMGQHCLNGQQRSYLCIFKTRIYSFKGQKRFLALYFTIKMDIKHKVTAFNAKIEQHLHDKRKKNLPWESKIK